MLFLQVPLGAPLPHPAHVHSISSSLPTWSDTFRHKAGDVEINAQIETGYPRYVMHKSIERLAHLFEKAYAVVDSAPKRCLLLYSARAGEACQTFLLGRDVNSQVIPVRSPDDTDFVAVFFDDIHYWTARLFWQHTGYGISSRFADRHLSLLEQSGVAISFDSADTFKLLTLKISLRDRCSKPTTLSADTAAIAKQTIRSRIAKFLSSADSQKQVDVTKEDVWLYPAGMNAIWNAHQLCVGIFGDELSTVCFGNPYCDTLKVLQRFGSKSCIFYPECSAESISSLETFLAARHAQDPTIPPISALFTEFPANPLLDTVDLRRLSDLSSKYGFILVVDDTLGNFVNVDVLPWTDIIVTSLSKLFSGSANVLGGSLVLNNRSRHYTRLLERLQDAYEDNYYAPDAIVMESNSRDFIQRSRVVDENAEAAVQYLCGAKQIITNVYYPSLRSKEMYDVCRKPGGGYGGLLSLQFVNPRVAHAFYDALPCAKGPSLGTNFTLACFYTVLAHFHELEWAAQQGIDADLVRISIGMEDRGVLLKALGVAVAAAEAAL